MKIRRNLVAVAVAVSTALGMSGVVVEAASAAPAHHRAATHHRRPVQHRVVQHGKVPKITHADILRAQRINHRAMHLAPLDGTLPNGTEVVLSDDCYWMIEDGYYVPTYTCGALVNGFLLIYPELQGEAYFSVAVEEDPAYTDNGNEIIVYFPTIGTFLECQTTNCPNTRYIAYNGRWVSVDAYDGQVVAAQSATITNVTIDGVDANGIGALLAQGDSETNAQRELANATTSMTQGSLETGAGMGIPIVSPECVANYTEFQCQQQP